MNEFELSVFEDILLWVLAQPKKFETREEMINAYWNDYFGESQC